MTDLEIYLTTRASTRENDPNLVTVVKINLDELPNAEIWIEDKLVRKTRGGGVVPLELC